MLYAAWTSDACCTHAQRVQAGACASAAVPRRATADQPVRRARRIHRGPLLVPDVRTYRTSGTTPQSRIHDCAVRLPQTAPITNGSVAPQIGRPSQLRLLLGGAQRIRQAGGARGREPVRLRDVRLQAGRDEGPALQALPIRALLAECYSSDRRNTWLPPWQPLVAAVCNSWLRYAATLRRQVALPAAFSVLCPCHAASTREHCPICTTGVVLEYSTMH